MAEPPDAASRPGPGLASRVARPSPAAPATRLQAGDVLCNSADLANDAWLHQRLSHALLSERAAGRPAWCLCTKPPRPLVIRVARARIVLARWPGDRGHDRACPFGAHLGAARLSLAHTGPDVPAGALGAAVVIPAAAPPAPMPRGPALHASGPTAAPVLRRRLDLAASLQPRLASAPLPRPWSAPTPARLGASASASFTTLGQLLADLVALAGLHDFAPADPPRNYAWAHQRLTQAATQLDLDDAPLSAQLLMPLPFAPDQVDQADAQRLAFARRAEARPHSLLLAQLRPPPCAPLTQPDGSHTWPLAHTTIELRTDRASLEPAGPHAQLLALAAGHAQPAPLPVRVLVLAAVQPVTSTLLRSHNVAIMALTAQYLPAASVHAARVLSGWATQGRAIRVSVPLVSAALEPAPIAGIAPVPIAPDQWAWPAPLDAACS